MVLVSDVHSTGASVYETSRRVALWISISEYNQPAMPLTMTDKRETHEYGPTPSLFKIHIQC